MTGINPHTQVVDRLSHKRSPVYKKAFDHITIFQLGVGEVCVDRMKALLQADLYIYPGEWVVDRQGKVKSLFSASGLSSHNIRDRKSGNLTS